MSSNTIAVWHWSWNHSNMWSFQDRLREGLDFLQTACLWGTFILRHSLACKTDSMKNLIPNPLNWLSLKICSSSISSKQQSKMKELSWNLSFTNKLNTKILPTPNTGKTSLTQTPLCWRNKSPTLSTLITSLHF